MTHDEIRAAVERALTAVAPEIDPRSIDSAAGLRDQLDIDSVDFLNFIVGVHTELGVEVPEADYPQLSTLDACVRYLAQRLGA